MFVLNQVFHTMMVQPDWDEMFKILVRMAMIMVPVAVGLYITELKDLAVIAGGINA